MKTRLEKLLARYDYRFPESQIAQKPISPRESAKLLIYDRKTRKLNFANFSKLSNYLKPGSTLVFNQTKVVPARVVVTKPTGGRIRLLYLGRNKENLEFLADRKIPLGTDLKIGSKKVFSVVAKANGRYVLRPFFSANSVYKFLNKNGQTPIPPYIKKVPLSESRLRSEYQTVFAKKNGSVAAPTASLHFSKKSISQLRKSKIHIKFITLHVGLGTFAKITQKNIDDNKLHPETYELNSKTATFLNRVKKKGLPIVAVGTTVLRALESASSSKGVLKNLAGETSLFIKDKYKFRFTNCLITNFHVPQSSLLMLVSALVSRKKILKLYNQAIRKKFRLFSFGDGMLIK